MLQLAIQFSISFHGVSSAFPSAFVFKVRTFSGVQDFLLIRFVPAAQELELMSSDVSSDLAAFKWCH